MNLTRNELCNVIVDEYGMGDLWYDESTFDPLWGILTLREWTKFDSPPVGWDLENSQIHMLMRASLKKFPRKYLLAKGVNAPFLESTLRYALDYFDTSVSLLRQARVDHFNSCPTSTIAGRLTLANTMNDQKAKQKLERITCGKKTIKTHTHTTHTIFFDLLFFFYFFCICSMHAQHFHAILSNIL